MSERVGSPEGVGEEGCVQRRVLLFKYFWIELELNGSVRKEEALLGSARS